MLNNETLRKNAAMTLCQLAVGFVLLLMPSPTQASTLALDFTGTVENAFSAELTFGWSFTVNAPIVVSGLGFFDDFQVDGAGLEQDHLVSLWDGGGALLAQSTITNASSPVASTAADGRWLFNNIAAIILAPGNYVIGAHNPGSPQCADCDRFRFLDTATENPLITFIQAMDSPGNAMPTSPQALRNDGYFGPNMAIEPAAVPEPASLLLLGTGAATLLARVRRRRQR